MPKSPSDLVFMDDPILYLREKFHLFVTIAKRDPVEAIRFVPEIASLIGVGIVSTIILIVSSLAGPAAEAAPSKEQVKAKTQEAKDAAEKTKDQVTAAVASGADKAREEVNKRTTRSTSAEQ